MRRDVEFLAGLLTGPWPIVVTADDFDGRHGAFLRTCQAFGFLAQEPETIRAPSCPHCHEDTLIEAGGRVICGRCLSTVDPWHLSAWRFDLASFLTWFAHELGLDEHVRLIDSDLWQLGSRTDDGVATEYLFGSNDLSDSGRARLMAYRNCTLIRPFTVPTSIAGFHGVMLSLPELLTMENGAAAVRQSRNSRVGIVRFDTESGALWIGETLAGDVPVGGKEYHLLACLAENLDHFVAYADLKYEVLRRSGSRDTTEEATFCQKLKGRIKKRLPTIDYLIATTNKGDGYRLRGQVEPSELG